MSRAVQRLGQKDDRPGLPALQGKLKGSVGNSNPNSKTKNTERAVFSKNAHDPSFKAQQVRKKIKKNYS